jgi:hypothetical protein
LKRGHLGRPEPDSKWKETFLKFVLETKVWESLLLGLWTLFFKMKVDLKMCRALGCGNAKL